MGGEKITAEINGPGFDNSRLISNQLVGFNYIESMDGCARFAMLLQTQDPTQWDEFVKNDESPFTFRFGTQLNVAAGQQSRLKSLRLLWSSRQLNGKSSATFLFKGTCNGIALNRHRSKDRQWKDARISDIVKDLIEDAGLQAKVQQTQGKFTVLGCNRRTSKFILQELLPLASDESGGGDWRLWVEDGKTVHFEPAKPQGQLRFTNLFRDGWVKLKSPQVIKDTRFSPDLRNGKIEVMMFDPDQDRLIRREIGEGNSKFNYLGDGRPQERKFVSESVIVSRQRDRHTDLRGEKLVENVGRSLWGRHARGLYRLVGISEYEPGITINQRCTVDLTGPLGAQDVNTGIWVVQQVKHLNNRGRPSTGVILEKRWER